MKKNIFFILFLIPIFLFAQSPSIAWQKRIGGSKVDIAAYGIQKTTDGGFIFGGRSQSDADNEKTENCRGGSDYWIVKTDNSGNIEWDKTIGGAQLNGFPSYENDVLRSVFQTPDGGYFLCGDSSSPISGEKTEASRGVEDIWVLKLSANRTIEWQRTIGGSYYENNSIAITTLDGGYLIHCLSPSSIAGEKTEVSRGDFDIWLVKLSNSGAIQWQKTIGGSGRDGASNVIQNPDGTYVMAGGSNSNISGEKTENSRGSSDIWLLKLDNNGNILHQKTIGGSGGDGTRNIIPTSDGNYLVSATSSSPISGEKTDFCRGGNDIWLLKIDPQFNIMWQKTYGGSADDAGSIIQCSDNGYFISGGSQSGISGEKLTPVSGFSDAWILKLNEIGEIVWQKTIGGNAPGIYNGQDGFISALQESDNSFIMFGSTDSDISGDIADYPRGDNDFWLVKLNPENLSSASFMNSKISVYPNPTNGLINFDKNIKINKVEVFDNLGRKIKEFNEFYKNIINLNDLSDGVYLIKTYVDNTIFNNKVILKR